MSFTQPVTRIIEKRQSCRSYTKDAISKEKRDAIEAYLSEEAHGPFGSNSRFQLIAATDEERSSLKDLGTYGIFKNPTGFILGAVSESELHLEDFGYIMEKIILKATDLDLGTCWLGGTFSRSSFADRLGLKDDEIMPAVTATGNMAPKRTLRDGLSRRVAKSDHRREWETIFFDEEPGTPLQKEKSGDYGKVLEMLRIGPSASNKQPWRVIREKNNFHFYLKRNPKYTKQLEMVKAEDLPRVDMGIAFCHFELSAHEAGLKGVWKHNDPRISFDEAEYILSWQGK